MNEDAQIHTLEGFFASSMIFFTVLIITKSSFIITPQSELTMDIQLKQAADDALTVLDVAPETTFQSNLTKLVAGWDMINATSGNNSIEELEYEIDSQLSAAELSDVIYNIDFAYVNENGNLVVNHIIIHGMPVENAVVATRLVALYGSNVAETHGNWTIPSNDIRVVEVRLIAWRI